MQKLPECRLEVRRRDRLKTIHFWHVVAPALVVLALLACLPVRVGQLLTRFCILLCSQLCVLQGHTTKALVLLAVAWLTAGQVAAAGF